MDTGKVGQKKSIGYDQIVGMVKICGQNNYVGGYMDALVFLIIFILVCIN